MNQNNELIRERALEETFGKVGNVVDTEAPPNRKRDILDSMVRNAYNLGFANRGHLEETDGGSRNPVKTPEPIMHVNSEADDFILHITRRRRIESLKQRELEIATGLVVQCFDEGKTKDATVGLLADMLVKCSRMAADIGMRL